MESWITRWMPRITLGLCAIVVVLGVVAVYILTQYQPKTACQRDAESRECQAIRSDAAKAQNQRVACIPFRQVGYVCPAPERYAQALRKLKRLELKQDRKTASKGAANEPTSNTTPPTSAGARPSSGLGSADAGGSGSGSSGGGGNPSEPPPSTPGPEGPPGVPGPPGQPAPEPAGDSVLGTGVDVPIVDECAIAPGLCR